jgi:MraZ protein
LQRFLVGHAEDVVMDAAGRVLISATLRDYAKLDKRVMLVGQGNKFELWDEARWQAQYEKMSGFSTDDLPPELEGFTL